jgi:hypothetical protein
MLTVIDQSVAMYSSPLGLADIQPPPVDKSSHFAPREQPQRCSEEVRAGLQIPAQIVEQKMF